MATAKKNIEIAVRGQKVVLKATEEDADLVDEIVSLVNRRLETAESRIKSTAVPAHQIAILALMDMASEYIHAKKRLREFKDRMRVKSDRLQSVLSSNSGLENSLK